MTDKMSLEDLYKQETGRTPIAEGCNGCSGYDVDYYDWLETRLSQREALLAQRTAERDAYAESLVLCLECTVGQLERVDKQSPFYFDAQQSIIDIKAEIRKIQEAGK